VSALAGVALLAALLARPAAALEVSLAEPRENGGHVWVDVLISDPFAPRVEESLSRGMPATLQLHAELYGVQSSLVPARMEQVLRMVGLWERRRSPVSAGRQRLRCLATAV